MTTAAGTYIGQIVWFMCLVPSYNWYHDTMKYRKRYMRRNRRQDLENLQHPPGVYQHLYSDPPDYSDPTINANLKMAAARLQMYHHTIETLLHSQANQRNPNFQHSPLITSKMVSIC